MAIYAALAKSLLLRWVLGWLLGRLLRWVLGWLLGRLLRWVLGWLLGRLLGRLLRWVLGCKKTVVWLKSCHYN